MSRAEMRAALSSRGFLALAERIAAEHRTTLDRVLEKRQGGGAQARRAHRARVGLWLTLSELHGLSTTEIASLTGRDPSTIAAALKRAWARAAASDPARQQEAA